MLASQNFGSPFISNYKNTRNKLVLCHQSTERKKKGNKATKDVFPICDPKFISDLVIAPEQVSFCVNARGIPPEPNNRHGSVWCGEGRYSLFCLGGTPVLSEMYPRPAWGTPCRVQGVPLS